MLELNNIIILFFYSIIDLNSKITHYLTNSALTLYLNFFKSNFLHSVYFHSCLQFKKDF